MMEGYLLKMKEVMRLLDWHKPYSVPIQNRYS